MEQTKTLKMHRVGTFTAGFLLIAFGILFLMHIFVPAISYLLIFQFWPCILILLGGEMLLASRREEDVIYDKGAIFLVIIITIFAMGMAGADLAIQYAIKEGDLVIR